ncbi:MAG TPA: type VI secretion system tube protein Hcp [Terriglobales bacterium]|nr:type VI secretion system tube protein Hcp [Terriglobales bacterium]
MGINSHFKVQGTKQGAFPSEIKVLSFVWGAQAPHDVANGQVTGRRQLRPLQITKHVDENTTNLFNALIGNETLTNVELSYDKPTRGGKQECYFKVKLTNAAVVGLEVSQAASEIPSHPGEVVTFTYEKIEITFRGENPDGSLGGARQAFDSVAVSSKYGSVE